MLSFLLLYSWSDFWLLIYDMYGLTWSCMDLHLVQIFGTYGKMSGKAGTRGSSLGCRRPKVLVKRVD